MEVVCGTSCKSKTTWKVNSFISVDRCCYFGRSFLKIGLNWWQISQLSSRLISVILQNSSSITTTLHPRHLLPRGLSRFIWWISPWTEFPIRSCNIVRGLEKPPSRKFQPRSPSIHRDITENYNFFQNFLVCVLCLRFFWNSQIIIIRAIRRVISGNYFTICATIFPLGFRAHKLIRVVWILLLWEAVFGALCNEVLGICL